MHPQGLLRRPGQGEQGLSPACSTRRLHVTPSQPLCHTGFERKSRLFFLPYLQPTGTRGARPSNVQCRQALVGWTAGKQFQLLQLGDEEEEETVVQPVGEGPEEDTKMI